MIKTFTIDWDSYEEMSKLGNKIKAQLVNINPNRITKKEKEGYIFQACNDIWDTNITGHYGSLDLDTNRKYYVYCHMNNIWKINPGKTGVLSFLATLGIPCSPFYIGKGTGDRWKNLTRNGYHTKLKTMHEENGGECFGQIIKGDLTEAEALACEDKLIDILGLKVFGGFLSNLDEGYKPEERRRLYKKQIDILKYLVTNNHILKDSRILLDFLYQ